MGTHGERVVLAQGNFADLGVIAEGYGFSPADGVLFDLGISSLQVDTPERGFSFRWEARLDMRFDIGQETTAHDVVNGYPEESLANVIFRLGEERRARRIARAIVRRRPIETTTQLADVVTQALGKPGKSRTHPATRTFQAIRMAVNQELENLERGLEQSLETLGSGGRLVVISYHSLEDRLVKNKLRREASECVCPPKTPMCVCGHTARIRLVNRRMKRPTLKEIQANPRSRSARMRVARANLSVKATIVVTRRRQHPVFRGTDTMEEEGLITAIDVGTTKVCTVVGKKNGSAEPTILAYSVVPCEGLKKGVVTDLDATERAVRASIQIVEQKAGISVQSALRRDYWRSHRVHEPQGFDEVGWQVRRRNQRRPRPGAPKGCF